MRKEKTSVINRSSIVKSFIFDTDIKNFLTIKNSIKWAMKTYLKILLVTSPLLMLCISYLVK